MKAWTVVLTNSCDVTSDYLCDRLSSAGLPVRRLDTDAIQGVGFDIGEQEAVYTDGEGIELKARDVAALILRRPKPIEPIVEGDEYQKQHAAAEWAEAFEGFLAHVPAFRWINHPSRNFNASHKIEQLKHAQAVGLNVPAWIVTTSSRQASAFIQRNGPGIIAKPLASGFIERNEPSNDTVIYTAEIREGHRDVLTRIEACPVLFQEQVSKTADVRLVVVADEIVGVSMKAFGRDGRQRLDIRRDAMRDVEYSSVDVPSGVRSADGRIMKEYGLVFGAFDFGVREDGEWVFFEINPNGQWAWLDLEAGTEIHRMFAKAIGQLI